MGVPIPYHLELQFAGLPIAAQEGYQALERLCAMRHLHLFRVKPKLHMHDHVSRLGSNTFQFSALSPQYGVDMFDVFWHFVPTAA